MLAILHLIGTFFVDLLFRSQRQLEVGEPLPSASAQYCCEACPASVSIKQKRSSPAGVDDPAHAEPARFDSNCSTRDRLALASSRIPSLLALENRAADRDGLKSTGTCATSFAR
jgi:hypothetical protein